MLAKVSTPVGKDKEAHAVSASMIKVHIVPLVVFCYVTYSKYVNV